MFSYTPHPDTNIKAFRSKLLAPFIVVSAIADAIIIALRESGCIHIVRIHEINNIIFLILLMFFLFILKIRPQLHKIIAHTFLFSVFFLFTAATIYVPNDEMRFAWHFTETGAAFLLLGSGAGWMMTLAALASVVGVTLHFGGLSAQALPTFCISLLAAAWIFSTFDIQSTRALRQMADMNRMLQNAAIRDPLTSLANRRAFDAAFATLQTSDTEFSLILVDLDRFKHINDCFGHEAGDRVLAEAADALLCAVRESDFVARLGGDEFAVLLPATKKIDAITVAEKLRMAVERTEIQYEGQILRITASVGVSTLLPRDDRPLSIQRSDHALYKAKRMGRNRVMDADHPDLCA
jgi:diguanylate cyclase (GGDEF)-like protein